MKFRTAFAISGFSTAAALSFGAGAAQETAAAGQAADAVLPVNAAQAMPLHNHMTEKLGVPVQQAAASDKESATTEKAPLKRHNHQRDMK